MAARNHDIAVGDVLYPNLVGPGYDSGTGGKTYFRVTAVSGRNISYAVACTTESSTFSSGGIAPVRYATVAEDADVAKTISNIAVASNIATLTSNSHGFDAGDTVIIAGLSQTAGNGAFAITAVTANTFTFDVRRAAAASSANVADIVDISSTAAAVGSTALRVIEAIPTIDTSRVTFASFSPFTVTINPTASLPGLTAVHARVQAGALRDARSNSYAGIADATSWNFGTAAGNATITNITSLTADGFYRTGGGTAPSIQVKFNQPVIVSGTPQLVLNAGADAVAIYASGSGTKTLTFTYTLGAGHSTLTQLGQRLNVMGLNLNGGTLSGVAGNTPVPASGGSGSLNANKSIVIDNTAPAAQGFMPFPGAVGVQATQALNVMFAENVAAVGNKKVYINTVTPYVAKSSTIGERTGNTVTLTTGAVHGLVAGNTVVVAGVADTAFNGTFVVVSAPTTTTITYDTVSSGNIAPAAAVGTVTRTFWETITLVTGGSPNVAVSNFPNNGGAMATITRVLKASTVNLVIDPPTRYYVVYEAGAFTDLAGNLAAGLSNTAAWAFEASPDVVAPVFNPSQSDPPHNMPNFALDRDIQLGFSEAVSTVATKTIRLCTGAADCATPIETFTLPSASVTSAGGGLRVVINPAANLTASATYFLLIDSGAFVDGADNPTASAVTAGQYQFTVAAPFSAPSGGSCGPPPAPPCNVGPGLNFGPGGMIQNPGAIGGSDMANLRPDNFMGFRPDDARNLGAGALQNFRPDQFGALPPSAMAGFDRNQIGNLNPAAMAGFNPDQMRALPPEAMQGFNPDQMRQLPPSAMQGFNATQMGQMPPSAMQGFNSGQMGQMPPSAMQGFSSGQLGQMPAEAMKGFNPDQMRQLPANTMQGFNSSQMGQLPPNAMQGFNSNQMRQLPPNAMQGFNSGQMGQMPPTAMQGINSSQLGQMPAEAMKGFNPDQMRQLPANTMQGFNSSQMGQLPPNAMQGFNSNQMRQLPPNAMQGFNSGQMGQMPPTAMQGINSSQLGQMPAEAMKGFNEDRFRALPAQAMSGFNPQQMGAVPATALEGMRFNQMNQLPAAAMQGFKSDQFAALPPQAMQGFKREQFAALPPQALSGMEPGQMRDLPPNAARSFSPEQVSALPASAMAAIQPGVFRALSAEAISALTPQQRNALPPQALNPPALSQPATAGNIGAIVDSISGWNINKVPASAFGGMKSTDMAKLPNDAFNALSSQQIGALPPTAMGGIKPAQFSALPSEAMAAFKPTQVGALSPAAMSAMTPAQMSALPPSALTQMKATQTAKLPTEAFETMKPAQVGAMPAAAVGGFKAEQLTALPAEAMTTMKPAQV
ncbi:MAG: Ig-like domain-containing protein, partial [Ilumatobacteraceae bacterium]|nr:Ig-like domain-containing protein [Ilumatobacteraceae bacterium]